MQYCEDKHNPSMKIYSQKYLYLIISKSVTNGRNKMNNKRSEMRGNSTIIF